MTVSRTYPPVPLLGVSVLCHSEGKVLMIRRGKQPFLGHWSLPGGMVEVGETMQEAAERELLEETGVRARLSGPAEVFDSIQKDEGGRVKSHFVLAVFKGAYLSGSARAADDALEAAWLDPADLDGLLTTPGTPDRVLRILTSGG